MSLRDQTFYATKWATILNVSVYLGQFVLQLAIAYLLGPDIFGLAARIIAITVIIDQAAELGFTAALIQKRELDSRDTHTGFTANLALACLLSVGSVLAVQTYGNFYGWTPFLDLLRYVLPIPILIALGNVQRALLTRELDFRTQTVTRVVGVVANMGVAIGLAVSGFGIWAIIAGFYANHLAQLFVLWTRVSWKPRLRVYMESLRQLFSFGVYVGLSRLLMESTRNLEILIIGASLGDLLAGLFSLGYRIGIAAVNQVAVIANVLFPSFSRLQDEPVRLISNYLKSVRLLAVTSAVATLAAYVLAPVFVLILGSEWGELVPVTRALCVVALTVGLGSNLVHPILSGAGRPDVRFGLAVFDLVMKALVVFAALKWGLMGVCYAVAAYYFARMFFEQWIVGRTVGFGLMAFTRQVADVVVAFAAGAAATHTVELAMPDLHGLIRAAIAGICALAAYVGTLAITDRTIVRETLATLTAVLRSRPAGRGGD